MLGFSLGALAVSLTIAGFGLKNMWLSISSVTAWILLGVYARTMSTMTGDIYYGLFLWACLTGIMVAINAAGMKDKTDDDEKQMEDSELLKQAKEMYPGDEEAQKTYMQSEAHTVARRKRNKLAKIERDKNKPVY